LVDGEDIPPPIEHFQDMKIPKPMLEFLKSNRIITPTPIQLQGIPTAYVCYSSAHKARPTIDFVV
jgi:ATP-dependent RNA helicase DDX41